MRTSPVNRVIDHLRQAVRLPDGVGLGDGELLDSFIVSHDEVAFAALVKRHGPMVWGVCRRLLHQHDAEDAFQATFLVLARKAASIQSKATVGNWLYGVARQTALQARRAVARRRAKEVQVMRMPDTEAMEPDEWADLQPVLDEELSRLPDIYRTVIVSCDLEGQTRKEAARLLGVPEGTVGGRLARARALLAKRLSQRGVMLSGGALAAILSQSVSSASVPALVVSNTIKVANLMAAGQAAAGVIPVKVAALTDGVMKTMVLTKLKGLLAVVLVALACLGGGAAVSPMVMGKQPGNPKRTKGKMDAVADVKSELAKLQGVWAVASFDVEGEKRPGVDSRSALTIVGDKWVALRIVDDENMKAECGILKIIDPMKLPLAVDFVHLDGQDKGKTVFAIVKVDGDSLKICYRDRAEDRPTEFKTKTGDASCGLETFNRQNK